MDEVKIPTDQNMSICSVRTYLAIAMILWYQHDLRLKHMRLLGELNYAWSATFHCDLHPNGLEKWQVTGPHAFTKTESKWLAESLRFLKRTAGRPARSSGVRRALETAPPPPGKAALVPRGSRKDEAAQGASRKRGASAPVKPNKRFAYHALNILYMLIWPPTDEQSLDLLMAAELDM